VFLHADGIEWGDAISAIVENQISRDVALQKLVDHAERSFRCLVVQGNEAAKDFLSQFLTKLIQSLANTEDQVGIYTLPRTDQIAKANSEALQKYVMKFLLVVSDYLDHHFNLTFDVSRVLEIACLIGEVLYGHGDKSTWLSIFESHLIRATRYSKIVYVNHRGQFVRSLDITNRCIVRLVNSCLEDTGDLMC